MLITLLTTHSPRDGAWLQKQVVDAVTQGAASAKTALIISDDEVGGWGDHVTPHHSPSETPGEWLQDPYGVVGYTHSGPGFRLLFYIVSPWIRGGPCLHRIVTTILKSSSSRSGSQPRGRMSILLKWFPGEEHFLMHRFLTFLTRMLKYPITRPSVPYDNQISPNNVSSVSEQGFGYQPAMGCAPI
ncbi:hypothetical protein BKA61DRAFT_622726, partial [Leptodontidium sp. MPI-SDFR-AT-0119]